MLYENTPNELYDISQNELVKHLYKIVGFGISGSYVFIQLTYHQEARPSGELKQVNGKYMSKEPIATRRMLLHTQINALVQGQDFEISDTGKITFK